MNHGFCAELCLECLLCNLIFILVVDLTMMWRSTRPSGGIPMTTYRCEVHQVDHAISERLYFDIYPLVPLLLDSFQIFGGCLFNSWRR